MSGLRREVFGAPSAGPTPALRSDHSRDLLDGLDHELDRALLRRADDRGIVTYREPVPPRGPRRELYTHELRRLQFLADAGLAEKIGTRTWRLLPGTETALRQAQLTGDIIKRRARHLSQVSDPRMPVVITQLDVGTRVTGRLVGSGWTDELQARSYYMLEGTDGRLHYIPMPSTVWMTSRQPLRVGDLITLAKRVHREQGQDTVRTNVHVIQIGPSIEGLTFRGQVLGYARGADKQRYAVVNVGHDEAIAFPARDTDIAVGREVRATSHRAEEDRRRIIWRVADEEHERQRQRGQERER